MDNKLKQEILEKAKTFFKEKIVFGHIANTKKLVDISNFNVNPFLSDYLAFYLTGNNSGESIAKALIYPRVLGSSITTSFGTHMQYFCNEVLSSFASTTSGIDIEFIDTMDGRKKYCQIKAGPNTINKDDVATIIGHFASIKNLARTNKMPLQFDDLIVGVFYGEPKELSSHYKKINETHPVYIGKEFWTRLTGDDGFYSDLIEAFGEVAKETDSTKILDDVIQKLASEIEKNRKG